MFDRGGRTLISSPFQPVDVDAVARRLKLVKQARDDGAKGRPPSNATEFAQAELEILGDIEAQRARALNDLAAQVRAANDRLAQLETQMDIAKMRQDTAKAIADFASIRHQVETEVAVARGHARDARIEYERFRKTHKLDRPVREVGRRDWKIALLVLAVVAESVFNGMLFANGSDNGLLGGFAIAFGLSLVNVVVFGVLLGVFAFRYVRHCSWSICIPAFVVLVMALAALVVLNLFVAHYRDVFAVSDSPPEPTNIMHQMIAAPLGLTSMESFLLLILGLCCGSIGMYEFFHLTDPYPGYAAAYRRYAEAADSHADTRSELLDTAKDTRDTLLGELESAMESLRGAATQRRAALDTRNRFITSFEAHERDLEQAARRLLARYRERNIESRNDDGPPHFRQVWSFADRGLDHAAIRALMVEPPAPPDAERLVEELDKLRSQALAQFAQTITMLPADPE